jgi:hypothetical protein
MKRLLKACFALVQSFFISFQPCARAPGFMLMLILGKKIMANKNNNSGITVAQLISQLKGHRPDVEIYMGGLTFYRMKDRGGVIQMEFNQMHDFDEPENSDRIVFIDP